MDKTMAIIGYARVSTHDQDETFQVQALEADGADRVFVDHGVSGAKTSRPELDKALDYLRPGDTLTVWKLDRLGRNTRHVLDVVEGLHDRGIEFRSLTEGLTTQGAMGKAMLTVMAAFATLERDNLIERTRAGLAAARANNRQGGRPKSLDDAKLSRVLELRSKGVSPADIGKMMGVSRATIYKYLAATDPAARPTS